MSKKKTEKYGDIKTLCLHSDIINVPSIAIGSAKYPRLRNVLR